MLLTRSPLTHPPENPGNRRVRLACVKHAASVRPEPGSNSPNKKQSPEENHPPPNTTRGTSGRPQPKNSKTKTGTKTKQTVDKQTHYRVHKQHPHKPETPPQQDRTTGQAQPPRTTPRRQVNNLPTHTHHVKSNPGEPDHTRSSSPATHRKPQPTHPAKPRPATTNEPPPPSPIRSRPRTNRPRPGNAPTQAARLTPRGHPRDNAGPGPHHADRAHTANTPRRTTPLNPTTNPAEPESQQSANHAQPYALRGTRPARPSCRRRLG